VSKGTSHGAAAGAQTGGPEPGGVYMAPTSGEYFNHYRVLPLTLALASAAKMARTTAG
jgi:hypothetical protein